MMRSIDLSQSNKVAAWLRELWELEAGPAQPARRNAAAKAKALRELIPTSILLHYDHLKRRGKRSVAPVKGGICGSCHLAVPSGTLSILRRNAATLNVCVNCGAFVYFAEEEPVAVSPNAVTAVAKKAKRERAITPASPRALSRKAHATA